MQEEMRELKRELGELKNIARENNDILRKMRRSQKWKTVFTFIYWIILLGVAGAIYFFLQPYIDSLLQAYGNLLG